MLPRPSFISFSRRSRIAPVHLLRCALIFGSLVGCIEARATLTATSLSSTSACPGATVSFATSASGGCSAIRYQWYKGTTALSGKTNNALTLADLTSSSAGTYSVRVYDNCKSITNSATLTVLAECNPCVQFNFSGSSASTGTFGNVRTYTAGNVSVNVSAFSRHKLLGTWSTAWLGAYGGGLGVTDSADGDASGDRHTVDNLDGTDNFVLFEFSRPVIVNRAYLGYVVSDSDLTAWIGTANNPFNNHLTLSDALLSGFTAEDNFTSDASVRWADLNAGQVAGNVLVIAALPGDATPEDYFKLGLLDLCVPSASCTNVTAAALTNVVSCSGGTARFSTAAAGTGPFTYKWRFNGALISGATNSSLTLNNVTSGSAGTYCVEVTGACGGVTNCATLTVAAPTTATALVPATNCVGGEVTFSTTAAGAGPFTYRWRFNGTLLAGATNSALTIENVASGDAGTYCVEVSGACNTVTNCATLTVQGASLEVRKFCPTNAVPPGALLAYSGSISNSGDATLTNVIVVSDQPTNGSVLAGPLTLRPGDVRFFTNSYRVASNDCGPWADTLRASAQTECGGNVTTAATASCAATTTAGIKVTKSCPGTAVAPGGVIVFTGSVSNTGNVALTNVIVTSPQPASGTVVFGPATLLPGEKRWFTNSYTAPSDACGPWPISFTANGRSICGSNVTHTASGNCTAATAPAIRVAAFCPPDAVVPGALLTWSGSVSNAGNISLTNVLVFSTQPSNDTPVFGPLALAPGQAVFFTNSYRTATNACGPWTDALRATARSLCGSNVTHSANASCAAAPAPALAIVKICPPLPVAPGELLAFTGYITNAGDVTVTNVLVSNDRPTNGTPVLGPIDLAPGESALFTNSYRVPLDACGPWTDTLTATGTSICGSNLNVTASASCAAATTPAIVVRKQCPPPVCPDCLFTYTGSVSNSGNITLTNVIVMNDRPFPNTLVLGPTNLAPGEVIYFTDGYYLPGDSCGPWVDTLTATATSLCGSNVSHRATASCPAITSPQIRVSKVCTAEPIEPGGVLTFAGVVANPGDVSLTNVVVVNSQPAPGTIVFGPTNLAPGDVISFTASYSVPRDACGPWSDTLTATGTSLCGAAVSNSATASCPALIRPGLSVVKLCPSNAVPPGAVLNFSGYVTNTGNVSLTNVLVLNDRPAANTVVLGPLALAPGEGRSFTASYTTPADACGPWVDTLTAHGTTICGSNVAATATASCAAETRAGIVVTKTCPPPIAPDCLLTFTGSVSNSGNVTLTNVIVSNDQPAPNTVVFGPTNLAPGQILHFTGSYYVAKDACGPWIDTLVATATSICGTNVTNSATAACPAMTTPRLAVAKVCPIDPVEPGGVLTFAGFVANTGDISLTNVLVVNDQPAPNTIVFGPTNLAPGAVLSFMGSYRTLANACGPWTDTLTATATSLCGSNVVDTDTVTCAALVRPRVAVTKLCPPAPVAPGGVLTFSGVVSNAGDVPLTNVLVVNDRPAADTVVFGPVNLAVGEARSFTASYTVPEDACGPWSDTVTATATSICGSNVTHSASASCAAAIVSAIRVAKFCPPAPVRVGAVLTFTGYVTNAGNVTVTNVVVLNSAPAPNTLVLGPTNLAPGQAIAFSGSYETPADICGPLVDTLTASGTTICGSNLSHSATASCPVVTTPALRVTKACPAEPVAPGEVLVFTGTVRNAGDVTLTNVFVVNNVPFFNAPVIGPLTLAPGEVVPFTGSYRTPNDNCGPWMDLLTATGRSVCGSNVSDTAAASCPASIKSGIAVAKICPAEPVAPGGVLTFTGFVTNTGNVSLLNVRVLNSHPANGTLVFGPTNLAPGQVAGFSASYTVPLDACGPWSDTLTATATTRCGSNVTHSATASCPAITSPGIVVTKQCAGPSGPTELLLFTGSVSNSGNVTLTNVVVVNDRPSPGTVVFATTNLAPGQSIWFTNGYRIPADVCGVATDTLTATATSLCGQRVTNSATASCPIITKAILRLTKECPAAPAGPGELLTFTGSVSNAGNITITNVIVVNDQPAPNTVVFGPAALAPGEVAVFSGSYRVPADACGPWVDTLMASGRTRCGVVATNSVTASCAAGTAPAIRVAKFCPAQPIPVGGVLAFTGYVTNAGNITLTNVTVMNDSPAAQTLVVGPTNLAPGQVIFFSGSYETPSDTCGPIADTLTARGADRCTGSNVTHQATANCPVVTAPRIVVQKFCPPAPTGPGELLAFSGFVSNAGNITLTNVTVVDDMPTNDTPVLGPITLAPGEWRAFTNSYRVPDDDCCGQIHDMLTARGVDRCTGKEVTKTATAVCPMLRLPAIEVTRSCPTNTVRGGETIAFSGIVSNRGNVVLTNVVVLAQDGTIVMSMPGLSPGEWMDYEWAFVATNCPGATTNIVTVLGQDLRTGERVMSTAVCIVSCLAPDVKMVLTPMLLQGAFGVSFASEAGRSYTIECADAVTQPMQWRAFTNVIGTGATLVVPDGHPGTQRFYRLMME